ncbi:MAG: MBL fold metallo-hydrolase [Candidatus Schekmanbacteria bacterium]|nr:MAG: MBL fold metallo-hydrolase [Candidatus Schekmanbacteria bacterium]
MKNCRIVLLLIFLISFSSATILYSHSEEQRAKEVAKGVYAVTDLGFSNCGFIVTDDCVVVVDTTMLPSFAEDLLNEIKKITDKPVKFAINTHWHTDHIGGNQAFASKGIPIIGQQFTRDKVAERRKEQDEGKADESLKMFGPDFKFTPPNMTFKNEMRIYPGGREIVIKYFGGGHTGGDAVVYIPDAKVLFSGDLFLKGSGLPDYRDDANIDVHINALKELQKMDIEKIVCGHLERLGSTDITAKKEDIQKSLDKMIALRDEIKKYVDKGVSAEKAAESIKFPEGENPFYKANFKKIILKVYGDIKNLKN